jgi:hypothetical protein
MGLKFHGFVRSTYPLVLKFVDCLWFGKDKKCKINNAMLNIFTAD